MSQKDIKINLNLVSGCYTVKEMLELCLIAEIKGWLEATALFKFDGWMLYFDWIFKNSHIFSALPPPGVM